MIYHLFLMITISVFANIHFHDNFDIIKVDE